MVKTFFLLNPTVFINFHYKNKDSESIIIPSFSLRVLPSTKTPNEVNEPIELSISDDSQEKTLYSSVDSSTFEFNDQNYSIENVQEEPTNDQSSSNDDFNHVSSQCPMILKENFGNIKYFMFF
jgi:hypothetical protein